MAIAKGRGTASCVACVLALVAALCCSTALATVWTVGDAGGWDVGVNYTTWADGKTFVIGDVLFFPYAQGSHSVVVVNQSQYNSCTFASSDPLSTTGNTSITLNSTGSSYYLCSFPQHCSLGMRLAVNVISAGAPAPSPSSPSPSPSVTTPAPSPASATTPTPSPASSPTEVPTPSPASTSTPTPSPASSPSAVPTGSPASTAPAPASPSSSPTASPPPPPTTTTPTPPASITPNTPPSNSGAHVGAISGLTILWTVLGSMMLML